MHKSFLVTLLLLVTTSSGGAQQALPPDLPARIDRVFANFRATSPGCGLGLAKDGRPLYIHGYGSANLEYGIPNSDSTVFESGSVAKQFTASAMLMLQRDGKLDLEDDIRKYLPEVPSFGGQKITIRNLLTHTSGLRDQWGLLGIEGRGPGSQVHSPMTTLDLVVHQKMLNFPPGSRYLYSNTGYALAAIIIERVSGRTLNDFSQERLFRPLGMTHTQWRDDYTRVVPNRATAYSPTVFGYRQDMPFTNMIGNGGLLSTMGDLLKWNENLDTPVVGGVEYVRAMETQMRLTSGRTIPYALGLTVGNYDGVREVSHSGSTAGYSTYLARYPEQRVSVAVWCNQSAANATSFAHQVADLVLTKPPRAVAQSGASPIVRLAATQLAAWAGTYRDPETDQSLTLVATDSTLVARRGAATISFLPIAPTRFRYQGAEAEFSGRPGNRAFAVISPAGDSTWFREVRPTPASLTTSDYTGYYASDELDARFTVVAREGKLFIQRRPYQEYALQPIYADDFQASGALGTLRFARDSKGRVTGFSFFAGRVLDVRFTRVK